MIISRKQYNELKEKVENLERLLNGGKGSGNFGHAGRPGEVGGSAPSGSGGVGGGKEARPRDAGPSGGAIDYVYTDSRSAYADGFDILEDAQDYIVEKAQDPYSGGLGEDIAMAYEDDARDLLDLPSREEEAEGAEMSMSDMADLQDQIAETIRAKSWDELQSDLGESSIKGAFDYGLDKGGYKFAKGRGDKGVPGGMSNDQLDKELKDFMVDFGIQDHYGAISAAKDGDFKTAWRNLSYDMRDKLKDEYDYDPMRENAFKGATTNDFVPRPEELYKNGGKGSGNFGHAGRPGEIGGSAPSGVSGGIGSRSTDKKIESYQEKALENLGLTDIEKMTDKDWENVRTEMTRLIAERRAKHSGEEATGIDPQENLQTAMASVYKIKGAHERVEGGRLVTDESLATNKEYKEALKKAEQAVDAVRKIDEQSDDWETQRKVAKVKRIDEKIGKKALVTTKDTEGFYTRDFMDKDGKEYYYDSTTEQVREKGTGNYMLSPAEKKAAKDGDWGNRYELTGAQIKKKLKDYGINTDGLSVSKGRGGYETAWHIKGSGIKTDLKGVERITKSKLEDISRDERSGEILAGGNTFVFVDDTDRWGH